MDETPNHLSFPLTLSTTDETNIREERIVSLSYLCGASVKFVYIHHEVCHFIFALR